MQEEATMSGVDSSVFHAAMRAKEREKRKKAHREKKQRKLEKAPAKEALIPGSAILPVIADTPLDTATKVKASWCLIFGECFLFEGVFIIFHGRRLLLFWRS